MPTQYSSRRLIFPGEVTIPHVRRLDMSNKSRRQVNAQKLPQRKALKSVSIQDLKPRSEKTFRKKNNIQSSDMIGFVDGLLRFSPFVMPRPIPTPAASYVLQRVVIINAPIGTALSGVVYAQPDLRLPMVTYYDDASGGRVIADTFEFGISRTLLLPSESFAVDETTIHVIPQLVSSLAHNVNVRPNILGSNTPSVCVYPDYRDPDIFKIGLGGKGYYNLSAATDNTTNLPVQFKITGVFNGPPIMDIVWYNGIDLSGGSTVIPLASTTISGDEFNFNGSGVIYVHPGSRSFTYTIKNVLRLDSLAVISSSAFTQANSFDVINGENIYAVPSSDEQSWNSTVKSIEGWAPTGLALTATSVSAEAFTGGNIAVGLIPVSVTPYTNYQSLYNVIESRRSYKYTGRVVDGAHGLWAPRTLSDVSDLNAYTTLQSNLIGIAFSFPGSGAAAPEIKFTLTQRYDLQLNTALIPSVVPLSSPTALARIFALMRQHLNYVYGDNPNHMARLKKVASMIVESETFKQLVKDLGSTTVKSLAATLPGLALSFI